MYLYNSPEYCETNFAALKFRGVPINVNYRYLDNELHYLLDNADVEALVFHTSLAIVWPACVRGWTGCACWSRSTTARRPTAPRTSTARSATRSAGERRRRPGSTRDGDEVYIFYTGGTTGMPKGVMYPLGEFTEFFLRSYPR